MTWMQRTFHLWRFDRVGFSPSHPLSSSQTFLSKGKISSSWTIIIFSMSHSYHDHSSSIKPIFFFPEGRERGFFFFFKFIEHLLWGSSTKLLLKSNLIFMIWQALLFQFYSMPRAKSIMIIRQSTTILKKVIYPSFQVEIVFF